MSEEVLLKIGGKPVYWIDDSIIEFTGEMTIDADGCPRAYGPEGCSPEPLDYLANAGYPGNWWGISCDDEGCPYVQGPKDPKCWPYPGLYVSTTCYEHYDYEYYDTRRFVDSEKVPFSVIPGNVRMAVEPKFMGCLAEITDKKSGKTLSCVCCDVGPTNHMGEASMAAAKFLGVNPNPKNGGSSDRTRWLYRFYPGVPAKRWELH